MKSLQHRKNETRERRRRRVRAKLHGTAARPRLSIFRTAKHMYAQLINDDEGKTVVAVADKHVDAKADAGDMKAKTAAAYKVGKMIAEKAKGAGVEAVIFDRNKFAYTGRVKALAEGAREGGLKF